jgi:CRP-like cAMP-binding protein
VDVELVHLYVNIAQHPKGRFLFHDGDHPDGIYLLLDGIVKVNYLNSGGDEKVISIYKQGDIFGAFFMGKYPYRMGTAIALTAVTVGKLSRYHVQTLIQGCPKFAMNFIRHLADEQRETLAHTHVLMHLDAQQRLLGTLLYLARRFCISGEWANLPSCITQEDIACIACVNRSTASLLINQLRKSGFLGGKGRTLMINRSAIKELLSQAGVEILE